MSIAFQWLCTFLKQNSKWSLNTCNSEILSFLSFQMRFKLILRFICSENTNMSFKIFGNEMCVISVFRIRSATYRYLNNFVLSKEKLWICAHRVLNLFERTCSHVFKRKRKNIFVTFDCFLYFFDKILFRYSTLFFYFCYRDWLFRWLTS